MKIGKIKNATLNEQVNKNTEDIELLAKYIKSLFNTKADLSAESTTVPVSEIVDFIDGTEDALLLTEEGLLFKIIAVSHRTAYLQFWTLLPAGARGPKGPKGDNGTSFKILGTYSSVDDLPEIAEAGDAYYVGLTAPRDVYAFDINTNTWINQGPIEGPEGERGPVGPKGERGPVGPKGNAGVGFDDATSMNLDYGEQSVIYDTDDGITISSNARIEAGGENFDIPTERNIPIISSEEIIFDATEDNAHVQAYLDNSVSNKINRALLLPVSTPASDKIVAVSLNNDQILLDRDDFLTKFTTSGGTLVASLPSGKLVDSGINKSNVEQKELIYDRLSPNPNINWGYTSGIAHDVEVSGKDFSKYKYIIVYFASPNYAGGTLVLNITENPSTGSNYYRAQQCYGGSVEGDKLYIKNTTALVNTAKTSFKVTISTLSTTAELEHNGYVYKIEGVY